MLHTGKLKIDLNLHTLYKKSSLKAKGIQLTFESAF